MFETNNEIVKHIESIKKLEFIIFIRNLLERIGLKRNCNEVAAKISLIGALKSFFLFLVSRFEFVNSFLSKFSIPFNVSFFEFI